MPKSDLDQMVKDGLLMRGDDERLILRRIKTGIPPLDALIGGGLPYSRNTMIVGPESTGKTVIAQYLTKAQQNAPERRLVLLIDAEMSFERSWWEASGVNVKENLYVSQPATGEQAVDIMLAVLEAEPELGMIILDSIPALRPKAVVESESAEQNYMGLLAQLVNKMFTLLMAHPGWRKIAFVTINQIRDNFNGYDEVWPGGHGLRHFNHLVLRTRRTEWIKEKNRRVGFKMEIYSRKNKVGIPEDAVIVPFMFTSQIDLIQSYVQEGVAKGVIRASSPYYYVPLANGKEQALLGMANLRTFFVENQNMQEWLERVIDGGDHEDGAASGVRETA